MTAPIYLDYQATTPTDPRVAAAMLPYLEEAFGNPHSEHAFGWEAAEAVDRAAAAVASLIGAAAGEIVFTSGATEASNLAIQGVARSARRRGDHIVTTAIEHKCVLATALSLRKQGFAVDIVPVKSNGIVDLDVLAATLRDDTALVSVMLANNEIGTVQPIAEIGALCRERGIVFHTDAAQAVGKLSIDVDELDVDLLSLSAHKLYGPKGIGALYVSRHCPVPLEPLIIGGAQQNGLRAGTVPTFLCAGLGVACQIAEAELEADRRHSLSLRDAFLATLRERFPRVIVNGDLDHRLSGNLNVRLPGVDAESLLTALHGKLAASTGSACNTGLVEPSYVLQAIGLGLEEVNSSIRFGFGRFTSIDDVDRVADLLADKAATLRRDLAYF
jgi:cysteine desulfurase